MLHLRDKYAEAVAYAAAAHATQDRKGSNVPYICHPVAVSALVVEHGGNDDQAIAGLLHDVLEDCGGHHAPVIADRFGPEVLRIVEGLTDGIPDEHGNKAPWDGRKKRFIDFLATARKDVVLVSACDKLHNATSIADDHSVIGEAVFDRFSQPKDRTVWYYRELEKVVSNRLGSDHRLARKLDTTLARWAF